jgi:hypothetical protein
VTGLEKKLEGKQVMRNVNKPIGMSDLKVTELYFQQLDDADVMGLYRVYEEDFKMFGYRYQYGSVGLPVWP